MTVLFFGYSDIGYEVLWALLHCDTPIGAVYTHADNPKESKWFRDVGALAKSHNIPTYTHVPDTQHLSQYNVSVAIVAYYRKLLPTDWLLSRPLGAYNVHGSLLPAFRGAQPTNWAVISGAEKTGITLHKMGAEIDGGDIVAQISVPILHTDTAHTVMQKLTPLAGELIRQNIKSICDGTVKTTPQDVTNAPIYPRRTPTDGAIDFRMRAGDIYNLVRGVSKPYPGAFFYINGQKITVWACEINHNITTGITGMVLCEGAIKCADTAITLTCATTDNGTDALPLLCSGMVVQNI